MSRMTKKSIKSSVKGILGLGLLCYIIGDIMDLETRTILYSYCVFIILIVMYLIIYTLTNSLDYINNEEEKISFLYEEFNYLNDCVIECERTRIKKKKKKYREWNPQSYNQKNDWYIPFNPSFFFPIHPLPLIYHCRQKLILRTSSSDVPSSRILEWARSRHRDE